MVEHLRVCDHGGFFAARVDTHRAVAGMFTRIYRVAKFQCPHCGQIIPAPSEPIADAAPALSQIIVQHQCPELEKAIPIRFNIASVHASEALKPEILSRAKAAGPA